MNSSLGYTRRTARRGLRLLLVTLVACLLGFTGVTPALAAPVGNTGNTNGTATLKLVSDIVMTADPDPASSGQNVSISATVRQMQGNPFPATGTVTFLDSGTTIGTASLVDGTATFTGQLTQGTHTLTSSYAGDDSYDPGESAPFVLTVSQAAPVVTIAVVPSPAGPDPGTLHTDSQDAELTVTATSPAGSPDYPRTRYAVKLSGLTGAVPSDVRLQQLVGATWTDVPLTSGGSALNGVVGAAAGTDLAPGMSITNSLRLQVNPGAPTGTLTLTMSLQASRDGGASFPVRLASQSRDFAVSRLATVTTVSAGSVVTHNASAPVAMTAHVTPSSATGTVTFTDTGSGSGAGIVVGVAALTNGVATAPATLALGSHRIVASYSGDAFRYATSASDPAALTVTPPGGTFHPLTSAQILDTRTSNGQSRPLAIPANGRLTIQVAGRGGVPSANVAAGVINVTVTSATTSGYLTMFAAGAAIPNVTGVNFDSGHYTSGLSVVPLSSAGKVTIYNRSRGPINVVADVQGYFSNQLNSLGQAGRYNGFAPIRLLDSTKTRTKPNAAVTIKVTGRGSGSSRIPTTGVGSVILNVTDVTPSANGNAKVYPSGTKAPSSAVLNYPTGLMRSNRVIVAVGNDGSVVLKNSAATVGFYVDVVGYFTSATSTAGGSTYIPLPTAKRLNYSSWNTKQSKSLAVAGAVGIPAQAASLPPVGLLAEVTARAVGANTYLTVYPSGGPPNTVDVAANKTKTAGNLAITQLVGGKLSLFNKAGPTQVSVDVFGWFG